MTEDAGKFLQWMHPIVTVVSLTFGGGILYADIQGFKEEVAESKLNKERLQNVEVRLSVSEDAHRRTVEVLEKVSNSVERLNITVAKLETKLEK